MKSKAQEYAEFLNKEVPCPPRFRKAYVTQDGTLYIDPMNLESNEALDFAYWIISTFDVSDQLNLEGVYETAHAIHGRGGDDK